MPADLKDTRYDQRSGEKEKKKWQMGDGDKGMNVIEVINLYIQNQIILSSLRNLLFVIDQKTEKSKIIITFQKLEHNY